MTELVTSGPAGTDPEQWEIGRETPRKLADGAGAVKHRENMGEKLSVGPGLPWV